MDFFKKTPSAPWSKYYREGDMNFKVPNTNFYNYFEQKAMGFGGLYGLDYYGTKIKYSELLKEIDACAKGLYDYGVRKGDVVTVCLPNTIEAVVSFFAINMIGGIVNFIHSSSSENEIKDSLNETNSRVLILFDTNYLKFRNIKKEINVKKVILVNIYTYMPFIVSFRHKLEKNIKIELEEQKLCVWWDLFLFKAKKLHIDNYVVNGKKDDAAVILHSGGTTGSPKGVVLSNGNLIAYAEGDSILSPNLYRGDTILVIVPMFHGFGLVSGVFFSLCMGMLVVLRPKFDLNEYCKMIKKYRPQVLAGVPSLFESVFSKLDNSSIKLDFLKYVLIGGDALKPVLREKFNKFLENHAANIKVTVGYGLTEAVCAATFENIFIELKEGTVGIPFPGVYVGIFSEENERVPYGEKGEICICGPTVMLGYYNNNKETNMVLQVHKDGNIWLHTGDLGSMDDDGFVTYISRMKRMIISSGYNVYPSRIEQILESHPAVMLCAVVGVPHKRKTEVPKAYIVLNEGYVKSDLLILELKKLCSKNLPKYAWPYEYEFRDQLPTTRMGKFDFISLQKNNKE